MRFIIRLIGVILFAAAFVILVIDGTRSIAGNALYLSSLAESVSLIWPTGVENTERVLRGVWDGLWDPAGAWLFQQPAFAVRLQFFVIAGPRRVDEMHRLADRRPPHAAIRGEPAASPVSTAEASTSAV